MFIGRHDVSVDQKGRVNLPSKIRDVLMKDFEAPFIVTVSDRCLTAYPAKQWLERYEALEAEPFTAEKGDLLRAVSENAVETPIKNGRILIPARLREHAAIDREAVIIGRIKKIEIWSRKRHAEATADLGPKELSMRLRELGF